jgi:hypothetical protein
MDSLEARFAALFRQDAAKNSVAPHDEQRPSKVEKYSPDLHRISP